MPGPSDVCVVVQGPLSPWTRQVLDSAVEHLPGAQVVFSSWEGSDLPPLHEAVEVVLSPDPGPGPTPFERNGRPLPPWNSNRMLVSTQAGLSRAERPYTLKLRADSPLGSDACLGWDAARRPSRTTLFTERIATCSVATRPPGRLPQLLHHPSDCVQFGRTEDVTELWRAPLVDEDANIGYWRRREEQPPLGWDARLVNEQLVWLSFLGRRGINIDYPHAGHAAGPGQLREAERLLVENFVVLEPWQLGVSLPKLQPTVDSSSLDSYFSFEDWLAARDAVLR